MRGLEPFILGMLTNFDALPLDRIHNMLKASLAETKIGPFSFAIPSST